MGATTHRLDGVAPPRPRRARRPCGRAPPGGGRRARHGRAGRHGAARVRHPQGVQPETLERLGEPCVFIGYLFTM